MKPRCRICSAPSDSPPLTVMEHMFGLGDDFEYFRCQGCGCLQILNPPEDWGRYYPRTYYSFNLASLPQSGAKAWLGALRDRCHFAGPAWLGRWLMRVKPSGMPSLRPVVPRFSERILEVGCGNGQLLSAMHRAGYRNLAGVDPFLSNDLSPAPGVHVRKARIEDVEGEFDLIMLHHVLEHIEDGRSMLAACRNRLAPMGRILVRIPVSEGEAWRRHGAFSMNIDAPRHYCIHTRSSFRLLVEQAGLSVEEIRYDSTSSQFWVGELYRRGLPYMQGDGTMTDPASHFSAAELQGFEADTRRCNLEGTGNQIAAVLVRSKPAP